MTLDRIGLQNASLDVDCRFSNAYSNVFWDLVRIRTRMYVHRLTAQCVFCFLFHLVALYLNALLSLFCAHPSPPNSSAITLAFSQAWKSDPGLFALWRSARVRFVEDGKMNALQTMAASSAVSLPYRPMWGSGDADSPVSLSNVVSVTEVVRWKAACYT